MQKLFTLVLFAASIPALAQTVTAAPGAGTYTSTHSVTLSDSATGPTTALPNAPYANIIPYTLNGTTPNFLDATTEPISVGVTETLTAFGLTPVIETLTSSSSCVPSTGVNCGESQTNTTSSTNPWPAWKAVCDATGSNCGGGTVVPASANQYVVSNPSLSGAATEFTETAGTTSGEINSLWVYKPSNAAATACMPSVGTYLCTHFYEDYWVYFPSSNGASLQKYENDTNDFDDVNGYQIVWGTQCNFLSGVWDYSTQSSTGWQPSSVPCNDGQHGISGAVNMPQNTWLHIQKGASIPAFTCVANSTVHGGQQGSGTAPCQNFDYLAITPYGGATTVYSSWGAELAAQTGASFNLVGPQFQLDADCASCTVTVYIDGGAANQSARFTAGYTTSPASFAYTLNTPSQTAAPAFSPAGGTYSSAPTVTISDSTSGATIYYTTNGTTPTTSSTVYTGPISVSNATVNAIALATGDTTSNMATATYTVSSGSGACVALNASSAVVLVAGGAATTPCH